MRPAPDYTLMYVTDPDAPGGLIETALAAARGGAGIVQLRDKRSGDMALAEAARALVAALAPLGAPLIVNDRIGVAAASGAAGVHLGQGDECPAKARALLGPSALIGLSVETPAHAADADPAADYLGAGPLRATATKRDAAAPLGLEGVAETIRLARRPVVVIGGVVAADAPGLKAAGAAGLAVVSAIAASPEPETAARGLIEAWRRA
ncbi:MAG: thiamine phosphate synthase [Pikeienuella sp.]|uniref:thiamine phosphate synthase n=1 Tax=Pikeienuella sp. TaxID=2831957 RepID=UPI0039194F6C